MTLVSHITTAPIILEELANTVRTFADILLMRIGGNWTAVYSLHDLGSDLTLNVIIWAFRLHHI